MVVERTVVWTEEEDPTKLLATLLKGAKRIGIEGTTDFHTVWPLGNATNARHEDDAAAAADGNEPLSTRPPELVVLPA